MLTDFKLRLGANAVVRRLPATIDAEQLLGGTDLAASLASGRAVQTAGLLKEAAGGTLVVPLADRIEPWLAGHLAQAMDGPPTSRPKFLVLLDDGIADEECPPASLIDRIAFSVNLDSAADVRPVGSKAAQALSLDAVGPLSDEQLSAIALAAVALGVESGRALHFAQLASRAHAALMGRPQVATDDIEIAVGLVFGPRATRLPAEAAATGDDAASPSNDDGERDRSKELAEKDIILSAAIAAVPLDLLRRLSSGRGARRAKGGAGGRQSRSRLRGRPLGSLPGSPRGGARLALIDTLRAAVPWQAVRSREDRRQGSIDVRKSDLRVRRFKRRSHSVTIFCVDASGSAAIARLSEAKGAAERLLGQAHVTRSEVALIAFRGTTAKILLPPTRSLTRARRALADLPGGGGTPLATGIVAARRLAETVASRGATPQLVLLTDGSANIAADGSAGRERARNDAIDAARTVARANIDGLLIDIAPRPRAEAEKLAAALGADYLPLPSMTSEAIGAAVEAARRMQKA